MTEPTDTPTERPSDQPVIETTALTREYLRRGSRSRWRRERLVAVDGLDMRVERGESVGYIGANGAGKSTTIKMLTGILKPTSGTVRTCGLDPMNRRKELARRIGVVFGQRSQLWWDLPTGESFTILAAIHRLDAATERARTGELVERLDMTDFIRTPVRQLSLGQRMRAEIAAALLHSPYLLILDEPTIGLDVLSKQRLREFLIEQRTAYRTTLLLTTHDMGDIERLCERVLLVDHGRLAYSGTLAGLARRLGAGRVLVVDLDRPAADLIDLQSGGPASVGLAGVRHLESQAGGMRQRIAFDADQVTAAEVLAAVSRRATVRDLSIEEPDIEDIVRRVYTGQAQT